MFLSTCTTTMRRSERPFARANFTKSRSMVSRTPLRVSRITREMLNSARLSAGRIRWLRPDQVTRLVCTPRNVTELAAAGGRQPAEPDREDHDQHHPLPEIRQAEAEDRPGHDGLVEGSPGPQAGPQAERNSDDQGQGQGDERQFEGRRHSPEDQVDRGLVEHEGASEVAVQGVPDEGAVLLEERPVQAERRMACSRSAWVASAAIRMSIGLPIAKMPAKTITDVTKSTKRLWERRRMMKTVMAEDPASGFGEPRSVYRIFADRVSLFWSYPDAAPQLRIRSEAAQSYEQTG